MNISDKILNKDEKAIFNLRNLYELSGYKKFKMGKFESYDFYLENKNFLRSESIITFSDLNGKLLALKPDVTLSIIKNTKYSGNEVRKLYYNENVYRADSGDKDYKEIMQTGLEYIGKLDLYSMCEVVSLAVKSLKLISNNYIFDISHMGFITALFESENISTEKQNELLKFIKNKNVHEIRRYCSDNNISNSFSETISNVASMYGPFESTLFKAKKISVNDKTDAALSELESLYISLKELGIADNINLDFSIINDMNYYSGIIFQGFIEEVPKCILYGGRYDNLLKKFGKDTDAIGFAIYLDIISLYDNSFEEYDVDALIIYDSINVKEIMDEADKLRKQGLNVRVESSDNGTIKYKKLYKYTDKGLVSDD